MKTFLVLSMCAIIALSAGCAAPIIGATGYGMEAAGGTTGSPGSSYSDTATVEFETPCKDALDLAARVGKDLGYSARWASHNMLMLSSGVSGTASAGAILSTLPIVGLVTKPAPVIMISVTASEDGHMLDFRLTMSGRSSDYREEGQKILSDLKNKITEASLSQAIAEKTNNTQ